MHSIYKPEEDSYLMLEVLEKEIPGFLKKNSDLKILEIGAGSGIQLKTIFSLGVKKENIYSSDINPKVVECCKTLGFNCIESDLFSDIRGSFDVIFFNPPYLPLNKDEPKNSRTNTTAGKKGNEIIIKFLEQAKNHLNKKGFIFLITSSLSEQVDFEKYKYNSEEISFKKLFFEKLFCWKLRFNQ